MTSARAWVASGKTADHVVDDEGTIPLSRLSPVNSVSALVKSHTTLWPVVVMLIESAKHHSYCSDPNGGMAVGRSNTTCAGAFTESRVMKAEV